MLQHLDGKGPVGVIENEPKSDQRVQRLLASREEVFTEFTQHDFGAALARDFQIVAAEHLPDSDRTMYLMTRRET